MDVGKTIVLSGVTKNNYLFTVYPWETTLVSYGAVYAVLRRDRIGYTVIYVGRTGELRQHLLDHPMLQDFRQAGCTHIGVHIESVIARRYANQMDLVANFKPELNKGCEREGEA